MTRPMMSSKEPPKQIVTQQGGLKRGFLGLDIVCIYTITAFPYLVPLSTPDHIRQALIAPTPLHRHRLGQGVG